MADAVAARVSRAMSRSDEAAITLGRLAEAAAVGERLGTKDELQALCGVSRGTLNEALRIIQDRGLVTVRPGPGGGIFAAQSTGVARLGRSMLALDTQTDDIEEAVRIRDALDPLLIEDALTNASPADIGRMRQALAEMHAAGAERPLDFTRANWQLHAAIARCSPHQVLRTLYLNLLQVIEAHTVDVVAGEEMPLPAFIAQRHRLHVELVDAIEARDTETAMRLIREHNTMMPATP
mgnify:CR=1 FL=1